MSEYIDTIFEEVDLDQEFEEIVSLHTMSLPDLYEIRELRIESVHEINAIIDQMEREEDGRLGGH